MTAEGWRQVERLLYEARQLPPGERSAFVSNIGDTEVRAEVASLLAAQAERGEVSVCLMVGEAAQAVLDESLTGSMLGHFQVIKPIGRGAMGEVYLAQDVKLGRQVALKLLPSVFQRDPERVRRFEREARAAAALNHPNIMTVHEVGECQGRLFIAAEYVQGETLADRLCRGPLPVPEAIQVGTQMAEALAAAHEKGVVHRDLKPANVKIKLDGAVKVLDFGLAKLTEELSPVAGPDNAPTETQPATRTGVILGTAAYMSPEQARGMPVDKRADIWAFGAVLYEMLTGRCAFGRNTMTDTLAAVVKEEPDLTRLPAKLRAVVGRCLRKDLRKRWQDIGDVRISLDEDISAGAMAEPVAHAASRAPWIVAAAACLGAVAASLAPLIQSARPVQRPLMRLDVDLGPEASIEHGRGMHVTAISPDGMRIAFACRAQDDELRICTRRLDQAQAAPLPGTEGVQTIFFSPDGKWIGFGAHGKLKKTPVEGGPPVTLCDAPFNRGADWGEDGFIVASLQSGGGGSGGSDGLHRIPENGGTPQPLTRLKPGEHTHRWPQVLPGAKAVLFTANTQPGNYENANIEVVSIKTGERKALLRGGYYGRYLPSGHLIYMRQGTLLAARMDLSRLALTSSPAPVLENVASRVGEGGAAFDFSQSGSFVYQSSSSRAPSTVWWLEESGKLEPLLRTPAVYTWLRFSPDGKRLALVIRQGVSSDIWVYDLERETMSRITFGGGGSDEPVWSPDGKHVAYTSRQGFNIWWMRADGSGDVRRLTEGTNLQAATSFSPDGKLLAFEEVYHGLVWTLPLEDAGTDLPKPGQPEPYLRMRRGGAGQGIVTHLAGAAFSPDGRWLAYVSNESGSYQVYVGPFPGPGGKWQISTEGGMSPIWSPNGRHLFYTSNRRIMMTSYTVKDGSFVAQKPVRWSDFQVTQVPSLLFATSNIDLAPDGKRFAVLVPAKTEPQQPPTHLNGLLNFFDELGRRVP
ncbi:MAG: PD40 domain-containing protein [Acidobacteria bacterium]|nr:PD40 domain-containing protein [Acidobacteriota bacterium]MBI3282208.1 PD40 domain-containing protein [Acidobacteriota bacterium]